MTNISSSQVLSLNSGSRYLFVSRLHLTLLTSTIDIIVNMWRSLLLAGVAAASLIQEPLQAHKSYPILTSDLIAFHKNLTQIESITGNEAAVGEWLVSSLKSQGYSVEKQYVEKHPARFNILAWPSKRDAKVLLSAHIDTVRTDTSTLLDAYSLT